MCIRDRLVWFSVSDIDMAVPISIVKEVVNFEKIYKVPKAPSFIEGIMNLRGDILPIVSTAKRLDLEARSKTDEGRIIVVQCNGQQVGFIADEIKGILRLSQDSVFPPDKFPQIKGEFLESIAKLSDNRLILILNMPRLLSLEEKEDLEKFVKGAEEKNE